jgi:hypothetical protein
MNTYDEYVQYARDCMRHARSATTSEIAAELERIARQYQETAVKLASGKTALFSASSSETFLPNGGYAAAGSI